MKTVQELREKLLHERPAPWNEFPDIGLYMDQIISYLRRQTIRFDNEDPITSAMINNYIKAGLLPRANGKRYSRDHIALLSSIANLKQVLSVNDVKTIVADGTVREDYSRSDDYEYYLDFLDEALKSTAESILETDDRSEVLMMATRCALRAYANKIAAEQLLDIMRELDASAAEKTPE